MGSCCSKEERQEIYKLPTGDHKQGHTGPYTSTSDESGGVRETTDTTHSGTAGSSTAHSKSPHSSSSRPPAASTSTMPATVVTRERSEDLGEGQAQQQQTLRRDHDDITQEEITSLTRKGSKVYRAIGTYEATNDKEISFKVGDILVVTMREGEWLMAEHHVTRKCGYIPSNFVREINSKKANEWFHENIPMREAERRLKAPMVENGSFLVSERSDAIGLYTLSTKAVSDGGDIAVQHMTIRTMGYQLEEETENGVVCKEFETMKDLVNYYQNKAVPGAGGMRRKPCSRPQAALPGLMPGGDEYDIKKEALDFTRKLGEGKFGTVHAGLLNKYKKVAIKSTKREQVTENYEREAAIMKGMRHENLVSLLGVCKDADGDFYMVMELSPGGALNDFLKNREGRELVPEQLIQIGIEVSKGMQYMEENKYIHRDLAARNVLVGSSYREIKIADFGMARVLTEDIHVTKLQDIPIRWCSPEVFDEARYSVKSDVWAFGILMVEIFTRGRQPFEGTSNFHLMSKLSAGHMHPKPTLCPTPVYDVMTACWEMLPEKRPSFFMVNQMLEETFNYADLNLPPGARATAYNPKVDALYDSPDPEQPSYVNMDKTEGYMEPFTLPRGDCFICGKPTPAGKGDEWIIKFCWMQCATCKKICHATCLPKQCLSAEGEGVTAHWMCDRCQVKELAGRK